MTARAAAPRERAASVKEHASSIHSCSASTVAELRNLLNPPPRVASVAKPKTTKPNAKATSSQARPKTKPSAKCSATSTSLTESDDLLSSRERFILATEVFNGALKALTACVKNPPPPAQSAPIAAQKRPNAPVAAKPLQSRPLNREATISPQTTKLQHDQAKHEDGLQAIAECCQEGLTYLSSLPDGSEASQLPALQVEKGKSAFILKLIALGLFELAQKEVRTLRKLLINQENGRIGTTAGERPISHKAAAIPMAMLLDFGPVKTSGPVIDLAIQTQIQILRLIGLSSPVKSIRSLNTIFVEQASRSPIAWILRTDQANGPSSKAAQQLETIVRLLLNICEGGSSASSEERVTSAEHVFRLRCIVLRAKLSPESQVLKVTSHIEEAIASFAKYMTEFRSISNLSPPEKYTLVVEEHQFLFGVIERLRLTRGENVPSYHESTCSLFECLALMAKQSEQMHAAIQWTTKALEATRSEGASNAKTQACALRLISLQLRSTSSRNSNEEELATEIDNALAGLTGDIRGDSRELDALFDEVIQLRKAAVRHLSEVKPAADGQTLPLSQACCRAVLASVKFSLKYLGSAPLQSDDTKSHVRFEQRRSLALKSCNSSIDAAFWVLKSEIDHSFITSSILEQSVSECLELSSTINAASSEPELAQCHLKASNLYWHYYKWLSKSSGNGKRKDEVWSIKKAIKVLDSRSRPEQIAGLLGLKYERLAFVLGSSNVSHEALTALKQSLTFYLDDRTCQALVSSASTTTLDCLWRLNEQLAAAKRCFQSMVRLPQLDDPLGILKSFAWEPSVLGIVVETILTETLVSAAETASVLSTETVYLLAREALSIYILSDYPIRRLRVELMLRNAIRKYPRFSEILKPDSPDAVNDSIKKSDFGRDQGLSGYLATISCHVILTTEMGKASPCCDDMRVSIEKLRATLSSSSHGAEIQFVSQSSFLTQLNVVSQFCRIHGHGQLQRATLKLMAEIQSRYDSSDSLGLVDTQIQLALQHLDSGFPGRANEALKPACGTLDGVQDLSQTQIRVHLAEIESCLALGDTSTSLNRIAQLDKLVLTKKPEFRCSSSSISRKGNVNMLLAWSWTLRARTHFMEGYLSDAVACNRTAIRLLNRAWACLENSNREKGPSTRIDKEEDKGAAPSSTPVLSTTHKSFSEAPFWILAIDLFRSLVMQANLYIHHGLFREANSYFDQASRIAEASSSGLLKSQLGAMKGDCLNRSGALEAGRALLDKVISSAKPNEPLLHDVNVHCAIGFFHRQKKHWTDEMASYSCAENVATELSRLLRAVSPASKSLEARLSLLTLGPRKPTKIQGRSAPKSRTQSSSTRPAKSARAREVTRSPVDIVDRKGEESLQILHAKTDILQNKAATLTSQQQPGLALAALDQINTSSLDSTQVLLQKLTRARILLRNVIEDMSSDAVFCILQDSSVAFPSLESFDEESLSLAKTPKRITAAKAALVKDRAGPRQNLKKQSSTRFLESLRQASDLLFEAHQSAVRLGSLSFLHLFASSVVDVSLLSLTLGLPMVDNSVSPVKIAHYLEMYRAASIIREKALFAKDDAGSSDEDLSQWPTSKIVERQSEISILQSMSTESFENDILNSIPDKWSVISIMLNEAQDGLTLCKMRANRLPFYAHLPLHRLDSRELIDEALTFESARAELEEIIRLGNESTHNAKNMNQKTTKAAWWAEREQLDSRLGDLLQAIGPGWLGGFRGIFSQANVDDEALRQFGQALQNILDKNLPSRSRAKRATVVKTPFSTHVLELFAGLGNPEEDGSEIEDGVTDLLHFVVDVLQFNGERNAYDEIDFDALTVETVDALKVYHHASAIFIDDSAHTVLLLDKTLQCFPWESLPCLRGQSISRLPSLMCLRERLLANSAISPGSGTYILNPSGDLTSTEAAFMPLFSPLENWSSIVGRSPTEAEICSALTEKDVYLYFGHGGGEQYIRSRTIKKMDRCAVTFLMGCSSGAMVEQGEYEPYGTPRNYMLAGCPALVATLWDVTDKDIDRFAQETFTRWGLVGEAEESIPQPKTPGRKGKKKEVPARKTKGKESLCHAVAKSREACVLKYLNGAAPVVWGVPMRLDS